MRECQLVLRWAGLQSYLLRQLSEILVECQVDHRPVLKVFGQLGGQEVFEKALAPPMPKHSIIILRLNVHDLLGLRIQLFRRGIIEEIDARVIGESLDAYARSRALDLPWEMRIRCGTRLLRGLRKGVQLQASTILRAEHLSSVPFNGDVEPLRLPWHPGPCQRM